MFLYPRKEREKSIAYPALSRPRQGYDPRLHVCPGESRAASIFSPLLMLLESRKKTRDAVWMHWSVSKSIFDWVAMTHKWINLHVFLCKFLTPVWLVQKNCKSTSPNDQSVNFYGEKSAAKRWQQIFWYFAYLPSPGAGALSIQWRTVCRNLGVNINKKIVLAYQFFFDFGYYQLLRRGNKFFLEPPVLNTNASKGLQYRCVMPSKYNSVKTNVPYGAYWKEICSGVPCS